MKKKVLLIATFIISNIAFAGQDRGGGGAVVCKNSDNTIKSVELLDLYQDELLLERKLERSEESVESQIDAVLGKLAEVERLRRYDSKPLKTYKYLSMDIRNNLKDLKIKNTAEDESYSRPFDLGDRAIILKDGCSIEYAAFYEKGTVNIVTKYFREMSNTDKAALLIHEAVYKIARFRANDKDSARTRRVVGRLFREELSDKLLRNSTWGMTKDKRAKVDEFVANVGSHTIVEGQPVTIEYVVGKGIASYQHKLPKRISFKCYYDDNEMSTNYDLKSAEGVVTERFQTRSRRRQGAVMELTYAVQFKKPCRRLYFETKKDRFLYTVPWKVRVNGDKVTEFEEIERYIYLRLYSDMD